MGGTGAGWKPGTNRVRAKGESRDGPDLLIFIKTSILSSFHSLLELPFQKNSFFFFPIYGISPISAS